MLGVLVVLASQGLASADTFEFVTAQLRAGIALVALSALGLVAGCVGVVLNLRPVRPALVGAVLGVSISATILWSFGPLLWSIYRR